MIEMDDPEAAGIAAREDREAEVMFRVTINDPTFRTFIEAAYQHRAQQVLRLLRPLIRGATRKEREDAAAQIESIRVELYGTTEKRVSK